jgi:hypothetical protein
MLMSNSSSIRCIRVPVDVLVDVFFTRAKLLRAGRLTALELRAYAGQSAKQYVFSAKNRFHKTPQRTITDDHAAESTQMRAAKA